MSETKQKPTLEDLEAYDGDFLPTELVAAYMESNQNSVRAAVRNKQIPGACFLGGATGSGGRVVISKLGFTNTMRYGETQIVIGTDLRGLRKLLEVQESVVQFAKEVS